MDMTAKVNEVVEKLKKDPKLLANFQKDPIKTVEKMTGLDLPDKELEPVVKAIKAKLDVDKVGDLLGGFLKK